MKKTRKIAPIVDRLKALYGVKTRVDLTQKMNVSLGTYDNWMARDHIPDKHLRVEAEKNNVHLEWLTTGEGEKYKLNQIKPQFITPEISKELALIRESMPSYGKDKRTVKLAKMFDVLDDDVKDEVLEKMLAYMKTKL